MLASVAKLDVICYTNPRMFEWFGLDMAAYEGVSTIEGGFLMFKRSFLTSLIMKSWITCALDINCIAPYGSRHGRCCGCHRYDQDALTLIASHFFVQPFDQYAPYGFRNEERFFFSVNRRQSMNYFIS